MLFSCLWLLVWHSWVTAFSCLSLTFFDFYCWISPCLITLLATICMVAVLATRQMQKMTRNYLWGSSASCWQVCIQNIHMLLYSYTWLFLLTFFFMLRSFVYQHTNPLSWALDGWLVVWTRIIELFLTYFIYLLFIYSFICLFIYF